MAAKEKIAELLSLAGVTLNGPNPYDPQVHDERLYGRLLSGGTLALGEAYMDGWWDADDLSELFHRVFRANIQNAVTETGTLLAIAREWVFNRQNRARAFQIGEKHYDIGNDLYQKMLDRRMTYTCGYWRDVKTLDEAQEAKLDLVAKKIGLKKGDRVLDIGGGWGSFAKFAAEKYGASVVAITVSKEQVALGSERVKGLPVEIRLQDYRDVSDGPYDHIVSLGMFEHVGHKNYRTYMKKVCELLKDDGLFLLHTIGSDKSYHAADPWIEKYIFPNGILPSVAQISCAKDGLFHLEDWHNFGPDYDKTTRAWFENFHAAWPSLKEKYGERFYRMWRYYLLSVAGGFRARTLHLWQIVLSKKGLVGGYHSVR